MHRSLVSRFPCYEVLLCSWLSAEGVVGRSDTFSLFAVVLPAGLGVSTKCSRALSLEAGQAFLCIFGSADDQI